MGWDYFELNASDLQAQSCLLETFADSKGTVRKSVKDVAASAERQPLLLHRNTKTNWASHPRGLFAVHANWAMQHGGVKGVVAETQG